MAFALLSRTSATSLRRVAAPLGIRSIPVLRQYSTVNTACEDSEPNFLQCVEQFFDKAANVSGVSSNTLAAIKRVDAILSVSFPI
ncbi:NADP-dependent glutamate dehydrogenase, partial [Basidiobolus ranarum]